MVSVFVWPDGNTREKYLIKQLRITREVRGTLLILWIMDNIRKFDKSVLVGLRTT